MKLRKRFYFALSLIFLVVIVIMLLVEAHIQIAENKNRSEHTSLVLINQVENIIFTNQENEKRFVEQLKEDFITRAKAAAYIFENHLDIIEDVDEIRKIAKLVSVDEIHLFDQNGVIFAGSVPEYFGTTMDDGSQIRFFKTMLSDKNLTLCQDMRPNTREEKEVMYAMVWMENGEYLVQIGIEPKRLLEELRQNEIAEVVSNMPSYDGIKIIVADKKTQVVQGSSENFFNGKTLGEIGVNLKKLKVNARFSSTINNTPSYCSVKDFDIYTIVIAHDKKVLNSNIKTTLLIVFIYMMCIAVTIILIIKKFSKYVFTEKKED